MSKRYAPIGTALAVQDQIAELDRRVREALETFYTLSFQLDDQLESRTRQLADQHQTLRTEVGTYTETERQQAVYGVRIEAWGFTLLTLGSLIQAVASIISGAS